MSNTTETPQATYDAGAAVKRGQWVKFSSGNIIPCVAGNAACGVALNDAASGERVTVQHAGVALVRTAASLNPGALISSDASGNSVTSATAGHAYNGILLQTGVAASGTSFHLARCKILDGLAVVPA